MLKNDEIIEVWKDIQNGKTMLYSGDGIKAYNMKYYARNFTKSENSHLKALLSLFKASAYILRDLNGIASAKHEKRYLSNEEIPEELLNKKVVSIQPIFNTELLIEII